jgi:formylglycine-generating enzyme required for sulfatase activity
MRRVKSAFLVASLAIAALLGLISARAYAQSSRAASQNASTAADKPYDWKASFAQVKVGKVPRMPDGKPSLEGIWSFSILTPLERPNGQARTEISAADAEEAEDSAHQAEIDIRVEPTATPKGEKTTDAYNSFWRDGYWYKVPMTTLHTSQVVDPPDGRVPPLTPEARRRRVIANAKVDRPAVGPEDRPTTSRCVRGARSGPPTVGQGAGSQETTLEIIQGSGAVVVRQEALHDDQTIYLDGRPRPAENIHLDKGASRGHWDGDTLVVETTNFAEWATGVFSTYGNTEKMHLIERFKRLDDTHLLYGFTIDDPGTWTKPWSAEFVMWRMTDQEQIVEYACHEGNVGIAFSLSAARLKEKQAAEAELKSAKFTEAESAELPVPSQPAVAAAPPVYESNSFAMEFVKIPSGQFLMGCSLGAKPGECTDEERPRHRVQISQNFEIQKTEVTQKQWMSVMGSNPSVHHGDIDLPVENVSFEMVQGFIGKLNARNDGYLYRLPTEAEWEYAARGGTSDQYAGALNDGAWYARNEGGGDVEKIPAMSGGEITHPVATKKANTWGVYDMRGNVQEWVEDYFDPNYYSGSPAADPQGPATGDTRVVRGGSYHVRDWLTRVSLRANFPEGYEFGDVGFRVVRVPRQ